MLHLYVSRNAALLDQQWLPVGGELWRRAPQPRDFFVGLPSEDLQEMRPIEAKYSDGLAMGRALLAMVTDEDGVRLVAQGAERYWSEHSERATLPSWVTSVAKFPADWVDCLGRWSAGTSEAYVRNAKQKVRKMQLAVVELYQASEDPSSAFGEEELFEGLAAHLAWVGFS